MKVKQSSIMGYDNFDRANMVQGPLYLKDLYWNVSFLKTYFYI